MDISPFVQSLYIALLFFVLTPGIFFTFPKGVNKYLVTTIHALSFTIILYAIRITVSEGLTIYSDTACSIEIPQGTSSPLIGGTNYYFNTTNPTGGSQGCESLTTPQGVNYNF